MDILQSVTRGAEWSKRRRKAHARCTWGDFYHNAQTYLLEERRTGPDLLRAKKKGRPDHMFRPALGSIYSYGYSFVYLRLRVVTIVSAHWRCS